MKLVRKQLLTFLLVLFPDWWSRCEHVFFCSCGQKKDVSPKTDPQAVTDLLGLGRHTHTH